MNSFFSLLDTDSSGIDDDDLDIMDDIIHAGLRRYIRVHKPGYTFDQVADTIDSIDIADENIRFTLQNPHTRAIEKISITTNILRSIQEEAQCLTERTLYDASYLKEKLFSPSPETIAIIRSWLPLAPDEIVNVDIIPFDNGKEGFEVQYDYLKVYFYTENGTGGYIYLPSLFKGEYFGTENGLNSERNKIIELLTKK